MILLRYIFEICLSAMSMSYIDMHIRTLAQISMSGGSVGVVLEASREKFRAI